MCKAAKKDALLLLVALIGWCNVGSTANEINNNSYKGEKLLLKQTDICFQL